MRMKNLESELEFLSIREEHIKDEQRHLKREAIHAKEEVGLQYLIRIGQKNPECTTSDWVIHGDD
jgi:hypothetical protein